MARPARAEATGATAGRIAARRTRVGPRSGPRAGQRGGVLKLMLLAISCCLVGFFIVLVIDVGASLASRLSLGESSVAELVDKVIDRVLDRDVPRARAPEKPRPGATRGASPSSRTPRAPEPALPPEDDARHVEARPDPQVEQAKQRLDEILRRL